METKINVMLAADETIREKLLKNIQDQALFEWHTAETREVLMEKQETVDIIILAASLQGSTRFTEMIRQIPKEIRIIFWVDKSINALVVGIMEEHGAEILESLEDLENILHSKMLTIQEEKQELEKAQTEPTPEDVKVQLEKTKEAPKRSVKMVQLGKKEAKEQAPQQIIVNYKDQVRELKTTKHTAITKTEIAAAVPEGYKEIIGVFSPARTGKTELAAAMALASSEMKRKTALIDLDFKKFGTRFLFPIDPVELDEDGAYDLLIGSFQNTMKDRLDVKDHAAYQHKNLSVFTALPKPRSFETETILAMINAVIEQYEVVILDMGDPVLANLLMERHHMRRFMVIDEDVETLDGWEHHIMDYKLERFTWHVLLNKSEGQYEKELLKRLKSLGMHIEQSYVVPVAPDALKCRYKRKHLYNQNDAYKTAINAIMGHLNYAFMKEERKQKANRNQGSGNIFKKLYNKKFKNKQNVV